MVKSWKAKGGAETRETEDQNATEEETSEADHQREPEKLQNETGERDLTDHSVDEAGAVNEKICEKAGEMQNETGERDMTDKFVDKAGAVNEKICEKAGKICEKAGKICEKAGKTGRTWAWTKATAIERAAVEKKRRDHLERR